MFNQNETEKGENISKPVDDSDGFAAVNFLAGKLSDNSEFEKDIEKENKEIEKLGAEIKKLAKEKEDLKRDLAAKSEELAKQKKADKSTAENSKTSTASQPVSQNNTPANKKKKISNFMKSTASSSGKTSKGGSGSKFGLPKEDKLKKAEQEKNQLKQMGKEKEQELALVISEKERKINELEEQIKVYSGQIEDLQAELEEIKEEGLDMEVSLGNEIKILKLTIADLSLNLSLAEGELLEREKLELVKSKASSQKEQGLKPGWETEKKIRDLQNQLCEKTTKIRKLEGEIETLQNLVAIDQTQSENKDWVKTSSDLSQEIGDSLRLYDELAELEDKIADLERELAELKNGKPAEKAGEICNIDRHNYLENQVVILSSTIKTLAESLEKAEEELELAAEKREELEEIIEDQKEQIKQSVQLTSTEQEFLNRFPKTTLIWRKMGGEAKIEEIPGWEDFINEIRTLEFWMYEKKYEDFPNLGYHKLLINLTILKELSERIRELKKNSTPDESEKLEPQRCKVEEYEEHQELVKKLSLQESEIARWEKEYGELRAENDRNYAQVVGEEDLKSEIRKLNDELAQARGWSKSSAQKSADCESCKYYRKMLDEMERESEGNKIIQESQNAEIGKLNQTLAHNGTEFAKKLTTQGREIKSLQNQLETAKSDLANKDREISQQVKELTAQTAEIQKLIERINQQVVELEQQKEKNEKLAIQIENYRDQTDHSQASAESANKETEKRGKEMDEVEREKKKIEEQYKLLLLQNQGLEKDIKDKETESQQFQNENTKLRNKLKELEAQLAEMFKLKKDLETAYQTITDEQELNKEKQDLIDEVCANLESNIDGLVENSKESRNLSIISRRILVVINELRSEITSHQTEIKELKAQLIKEQEEKEILMAENSRIDWVGNLETNRELEEHLDSAHQEIEKLRDEKSELEADLEAARAALPEEVDMTARNYKKRIEELTGVHCSRELNLTELADKLGGAKLAALPGTLAEYLTQTQSDREQLNSAQAEIINLQEEWDQERDEVEKIYQNEKNHWEQNLTQAQTELNSTQKDITKLKNKLQKAEKGLVQANQKNLTLTEQTRDQDKLIKKLNEAEGRQIEANIQAKKINQKNATQVAKLNHQNEQLSKKVQTSRLEKEVLTEKNDILNWENTDLKQKLVNLDGLLTEKDLKLSQAAQKWDKLRTKVSTLRKRLKEQDEKWNQENDEWTAEVKELEKKLGGLGVELGRERVKKEKINRSKIEFRTLAKDLKTEKEDVEWKLEVRTKQRDKARKRLNDLKTKQKELVQTAESKKVSLTLIKYSPPLSSSEPEKDNTSVQETITTSNSLVDAIATTQTHLGIADLTKIAVDYEMPEGKSLSDLIEFYNNPPQGTTPTTPLDYHVCPPTCSETYHRQLEQAVIEELNTHLGLRLKKPTLNQMVNHLNQLLRKPLSEVKPVNQSRPTPIIKRGIELEQIRQTSLRFLSEILSTLPAGTQERIAKAQSYQEVAQIEKNLIQAHLDSKAQTNQVLQIKNDHLNYWRWVLIILIVFKGLVISGLAVKLTRANKTKRLK